MNKREAKQTERDARMLENSILFQSGEVFSQAQAMLALRLQPRTIKAYHDAPVRAWNAIAALCNRGVCDLSDKIYGSQHRYRRIEPHLKKE